jgi:DNA-binding transcriptional regulator YdaS (Cro superfamily)
MTLEEYFKKQPRGAKTEMCRELGITKSWLSLIISGKKPAGKSLAVVISMYTDDQVTIQDLR